MNFNVGNMKLFQFLAATTNSFHDRFSICEKKSCKINQENIDFTTQKQNPRTKNKRFSTRLFC